MEKEIPIGNHPSLGAFAVSVREGTFLNAMNNPTIPNQPNEPQGLMLPGMTFTVEFGGP